MASEQNGNLAGVPEGASQVRNFYHQYFLQNALLAAKIHAIPLTSKISALHCPYHPRLIFYF